MHSATEMIHEEALKKEKLRVLPAVPFSPRREIKAKVSSTGFVEFDANRYSVPTEHVGKAAEISAYPEQIEIRMDNRLIASHARSFEKRQKIEHPSHRQKLLSMPPELNRSSRRTWWCVRSAPGSTINGSKFNSPEAINPVTAGGDKKGQQNLSPDILFLLCVAPQP